MAGHQVRAISYEIDIGTSTSCLSTDFIARTFLQLTTITDLQFWTFTPCIQPVSVTVCLRLLRCILSTGAAGQRDEVLIDIFSTTGSCKTHNWDSREFDTRTRSAIIAGKWKLITGCKGRIVSMCYSVVVSLRSFFQTRKLLKYMAA